MTKDKYVKEFHDLFLHEGCIQLGYLADQST